ncbi:MAG: glycosyltransferase [Candidatus Aquirickettsiella sp.]
MDLAVLNHPQIRNIDELADKMQEDSFYLENNLNEVANKTTVSPFFKENNIFNGFWQCVKREMIGLKNLAAASDLLRYAILYQEGGYYFDTDTKFHLTPESILCSENNILGFKVQGAYAIENDIFSFGGGNDLIAALPKHPILKQVIKDLLHAYNKGDLEQLVLPLEKPVKEKSVILTEMDLKRAMKSIHPYSQEACIALTLNYTGPGELYNAIKLFWEENKYPQEVLSSMLAYGQVGNLTPSYPRAKKIFKPFRKHPLTFANIEVESDSHTTWMKQAQTRGTSFDDMAVTSFFKPKRESAELSESTNLKVFEC